MADNTNALAVKEPTPIIVGPGTTFHHLAVKQEWLEEKRAELVRGEAAYKALRSLPKVSGWRLSIVRERLAMLRKAVKAMALGYVPIPRFEAADLTIDYTELPSGALVALAEAEKAKVFDVIRFVTGREEGGRGAYRRRARDPLLVGVIRAPAHWIQNRGGSHREYRPAREEHFLVAYWQPSDERDEDMF